MINRASTSFAQIRKRVITKHNLLVAPMVAVYRIFCLTVLFYTSKTFTLYKRNLRQIDSFRMQCLKTKILKLIWQDRVSYVDILQRTGMVSAECLLLSNWLRWAATYFKWPTLGCPSKFSIDS